MNITCSICTEIFDAQSDMHVTGCGHLFHHVCLVTWFERSKSRLCPSCRQNCNKKDIHKVFFSLANTDHLEDAASLQAKVDNLEFQATIKEQEIKKLKTKLSTVKEQLDGLKDMVKVLEHEKKSTESMIHALKDQISYLKIKCKETDRLCNEVTKLKLLLKDSENVQRAIAGSRAEVNEMLKNENNIESLALLAATLKKTLIDTDLRKRDLERRLKTTQNELTTLKRDANNFECQFNELKQEYEQNKQFWVEERRALKEKIMSSKENLKNKSEISSEPVFDGNDTITPLPERVHNINNSDSPYLTAKSSIAGFDILNTKFINKASLSAKHKTTKPGPKRLEDIKIVKSSKPEDVDYNGLGGSSRDDVFPDPLKVCPKKGIKRHQPSATISSLKFRKLAPNPQKKLTDMNFGGGSA